MCCPGLTLLGWIFRNSLNVARYALKFSHYGEAENRENHAFAAILQVFRAEAYFVSASFEKLQAAFVFITLPSI